MGQHAGVVLMRTERLRDDGVAPASRPRQRGRAVPAVDQVAQDDEGPLARLRRASRVFRLPENGRGRYAHRRPLGQRVIALPLGRRLPLPLPLGRTLPLLFTLPLGRWPLARDQRFGEADVQVHRTGVAHGGRRARSAVADSGRIGSAHHGVWIVTGIGVLVQVRGESHGVREDARLDRGLVGTRTPQGRGAIGRCHDHRHLAVMGLEYRRMEVRYRGARGGHQQRRDPAGLGQPQGEKAGRALIDAHMQPDQAGLLGRIRGIRQRRGA